MKHARFRRTAASVAAAAVGIGGLVAMNAASSSAAVPTSGERIVHWSTDLTSGQKTVLPEIVAPAGQRFTEVYPSENSSSVVALTTQNRVVLSGATLPAGVPADVLDAPVRDLSSDGTFVAVVTGEGDVVAWGPDGRRSVRDDICPADQVAASSGGIVVVCEDGTVEVDDNGTNPPLLDVPDGLSDVQQVVFGTIPVALNGDGKVYRWGQQGGQTFSEEIPETVGKDIAVIGDQHAITTDGALVSFDRDGRNLHFLPGDEGGIDPTLAAQGIAAISSSRYAGYATTRDGNFASWGATSGPRLSARQLPTELNGLRLAGVGATDRHVALIVADTDPPAGPVLVSDSAVTGAADDGTTVPGTTLTGTPATFDPAPDAITTDWLVNGEAVAASTGQTSFTVTTAMLGKEITFRTRATGGGLTEALDSVTEPITVLAPVGRRVVTASQVNGPIAAGNYVEGVQATFDSPPTTTSTRWYVDGTEVLDARNQPGLSLTDDMVGKDLEFETRATWAADQGALPTITSRSTPTEIRIAFTTITQPVITGDPVVGSTLSIVSKTVFSDDADDVVIEGSWLRNGETVVGFEDTYTLTAADIGSYIMWSEFAYRTGLPAEIPAYGFSLDTMVGPITAAPLAITGTPVIVGDPYIGEELSVTPAPSNDPEATVSYDWKVGGESTGDTDTAYTPTEADAGKTITVVQVVSRGGATEAGPDYASAESSATAAVSERPADLAVESAATLTGTAIEGETLTGTPATFSPTENVTVANFWVIGGTETPAEGTTLVLTADHVGQNIQFKSVATRGQDTLSSTSTTVGPVLAKLAVTTAASVSGTPEVGQTLTATPAVFTTTEGVTVTNRWLADGTPIEGATGLTLTLTDAQLGAAITFESRAVRGDEAPVVSESAPTADVIRTPITVTTAATVAGEAKVGQTLTGTPAVFSITDGVTVSNRWLANGAPIEGATGTTLELTEAHLGQTITFESSATRGDETPVVSAAGPVGPVLPDEPVDPVGEVSIDLNGPTAPGATITVNVGTDFAGQQVQVYLSNLERLLAPATVAADGTIQVLVPGDIPLGTHRLAVYADGALVGFDDFAVTIVRPEDPAFKDKVSVDPKEVRAGQQVTVTIGADRAGQSVRVVVFSTARDLGFATVAADGTVKVTIPADLAAGVHRLAVYDAAGALIGYQDFTVLADQAGGGRNGVLPSTGAGDVGPMIPLGLTFLLAGLGLLVFRSRGRTQLG